MSTPLHRQKEITSNILLNALLLAGPDPGTLKQAHPLMMPPRPNWEAELGRGERRDQRE